SLLSDSGELVRVFALGSGVNPLISDLALLPALPDTVDPGESFTVPLRRGGRIIGAFRGQATLGLTSAQVDTLAAVCNLLAAAIAPVDLSDLVPKVVDQMSTILLGRAVVTEVEPGVVAFADALAVERVLANLLSNAAKYTPPETEIGVGLERGDDVAVLCVT